VAWALVCRARDPVCIIIIIGDRHFLEASVTQVTSGPISSLPVT
jgi:hypothetical protein